MTSMTVNSNTTRRSSFARVPAAFRLQFAVPYSFIWLPIIIFVLAWALTYGVLGLVDSQIPGRIPSEEPINATGGAQATIWYLGFMAAYTASHTFPFSVALGYSRRVYLLGTYLMFVVVSAGYALAAMFAYWVETATNGFGRHMYVFGAPSFQEFGGMFGVGSIATVVVLFFMCFGFFWAILYRRVSIAQLWAVIIGVIAVLLGVVALVTMNDGWVTVGRWFMRQTAFSLAGWGLLPVIALGGVNYSLIPKATVS